MMESVAIVYIVVVCGQAQKKWGYQVVTLRNWFKSSASFAVGLEFFRGLAHAPECGLRQL